MKLMSRSDNISTPKHSLSFSPKKLIFQLAVACTFLLFLQPVFSAENDLGASTKVGDHESPLPYMYQLENRSDPFTPFITEKAASTVDMDEIVDNTGPLTGMQLFEPGQLTLVAFMKKGEENLAMVQDFTGKGYVLSEGIKIGRRGVVKTIAPKSVIVEETAVTRAGKKIVTEVVMLLKKEGEE